MTIILRIVSNLKSTKKNYGIRKRKRRLPIMSYVNKNNNNDSDSMAAYYIK